VFPTGPTRNLQKREHTNKGQPTQMARELRAPGGPDARVGLIDRPGAACLLFLTPAETSPRDSAGAEFFGHASPTRRKKATAWYIVGPSRGLQRHDDIVVPRRVAARHRPAAACLPFLTPAATSPRDSAGTEFLGLPFPVRVNYSAALASRSQESVACERRIDRRPAGASGAGRNG
jgi:hypothetical protein